MSEGNRCSWGGCQAQAAADTMEGGFCGAHFGEWTAEQISALEALGPDEEAEVDAYWAQRDDEEHGAPHQSPEGGFGSDEDRPEMTGEDEDALAAWDAESLRCGSA